MIQIYKYSISFCLLLLLPLLAIGQVNSPADTVIQQVNQQVNTPDTSLAAGPIRLQGLRFGIDLKPWIQSIASSDRSFYNAHLRLDAGPGTSIRYGAMLDFTHSEANLQGDSATYFNKGNAARLGLYLNIIPDDQDFNLVTVGIGYGRSWFNESLSGLVDDSDYGSFPVYRSSIGLGAGWIEITGGMQARIWKQLYVGYNLQLRLLPHFKDRDLLQIYEIPGFGKASRKSSFGFSYFLLYRIPFR